MLRFFHPSLEKRLLAKIWPTWGDLGSTFGALGSHKLVVEHLFVAQSFVAIANLAMCIWILFAKYPRPSAEIIIRKLEKLLAARIESDRSIYPVEDMLPLEEELVAWDRYLARGGLANVRQINLTAVLGVIYAPRLSQYQTEYRKGYAAGLSDPNIPYGTLCFLTKRFLSHVCGRPIQKPDDPTESGFDEIALCSFYFTRVWLALNEVIDKERNA